MSFDEYDRIQALQERYERQFAVALRLPKLTHEEREIRRLREALEPFAKHGEKLKAELPDVPDDHVHDGIPMRSWRIAARVGRANG